MSISILLCFVIALAGCRNVNNNEVPYNSDEGFIPALQAYVLEDYGIEHSAAEMEKRILADAGLQDADYHFVVLQLPYMEGSEIRNDVDTVRIVGIKMDYTGKNIASAYSAAFALDQIDKSVHEAPGQRIEIIPYAQCMLPPVEGQIHFIATKIHDMRYGVYMPPNYEERLPLNDSGIVVVSYIDINPPESHQLPEVIFSDPDMLVGVEMVIHSVDATGISFSLINTTQNEYEFNQSFMLYIKYNDSWMMVDLIEYESEEYGFAEGMTFLFPDSETDIHPINWEWLYGKLGEGDYKICKELILYRSIGNYNVYKVEQEFIITDEMLNT